MASITGALTFLHDMLTGKVEPWGKFKNAVPPCSLTNVILKLQSVCFDLPVPYRIVYSTHAMGFEPRLESPSAVPLPRFFRIR